MSGGSIFLAMLLDLHSLSRRLFLLTFWPFCCFFWLRKYAGSVIFRQQSGGYLTNRFCDLLGGMEHCFFCLRFSVFLYSQSATLLNGCISDWLYGSILRFGHQFGIRQIVWTGLRLDIGIGEFYFTAGGRHILDLCRTGFHLFFFSYGCSMALYSLPSPLLNWGHIHERRNRIFCLRPIALVQLRDGSCFGCNAGLSGSNCIL